MKLQGRKRSIWSTFKNAYLRNHNLKSFWNKLNKENLTKDLIKTFDLFVNSKSYEWSSKFWRRLVINHLKVISFKSFQNSQDDLGKEYFTFTNFNDEVVRNACQLIEKNTVDLKVNIFKKHKNFSHEESINHNVLLYLLYENIKNKPVFKQFEKILIRKKNFFQEKPTLRVNNDEISQDDLNSLFEYEKISILLGKVKNIQNNILEIGSGSGRTTQTVLALKNNIKYVVADIPPAINFSFNNIKNLFPEKKISLAFEAKTQQDLLGIFEKNDVMYIFPHQIEMLPKKLFDVSIAIDCLHEMEEKIVKKYITTFEDVSKSLYFKVWEYAGLPNSFYKTYSIHNKKDYFIKEKWSEIFRERCIFPSNYYQSGYIF
jgi:putative sugar O-methyltransferase